MKKILLINSSNRKRNTYKLLSSIEVLLKENDFETELINLGDYNIHFCKGCEVCVLKSGCFIKDDVNLILDKIIKADGLIIGTPVYLNNMTGMLKSLIDRTCSWFHRTPVAQMPTLLLANTQGSGIDSTLNSIKESMVQWGVALCGTISRTGQNFDKPIEAKELSKFIDLVNSSGKGYKPSFKEISTYNTQRTLATNIFDLDKDYWVEKNWLDECYFPGSNVNFIKKTYGNMMYKMLCKVIKPIRN